MFQLRLGGDISMGSWVTLEIDGTVFSKRSDAEERLKELNAELDEQFGEDTDDDDDDDGNCDGYEYSGNTLSCRPVWKIVELTVK